MDIQKFLQIMSDKGLTVSEMAKMLGMDDSTLYRKIKRNGETFTVGDLENIRKAFGMDARTAAELLLR